MEEEIGGGSGGDGGEVMNGGIMVADTAQADADADGDGRRGACSSNAKKCVGRQEGKGRGQRDSRDAQGARKKSHLR